MAFKPFSNEELNFLKFSSLVLDEFPKGLRKTFIFMWDNKISPKPGYQLWDDSPAVRGMLLVCEGGKTDIPTNQSIDEWDCTALFKATIYAKTFSVPGKKALQTLSDVYLRKTKLASGSFHPSVSSFTGNDDETFSLAIDQLRLLRNALCHSSQAQLSKADFDRFLQLARDAFVAIKLSTVSVDAIGGLTEDEFPTEKVNKLKECRLKELQAINLFLQNVHEDTKDTKDAISAIDDRTLEMHKLMTVVNDSVPLPKTNIPSLVSDFTGRETECQRITSLITSGTTRLVNIWGPPGFGKTSTVIAVAHHLLSLGHPVYYSTFRGKNSKVEFISKLLCIFDNCKSNASAALLSADRLLHFIREIPCDFFLVLDNLDDLLASKASNDSSVSVKDELVEMLEEIVTNCPNIKLLSTTRESLEFMQLKLKGFETVKIGPLERHSSNSLICKFLPSINPEVSLDVAKITGNIPLAIRVLCSLISESTMPLQEAILDLKNSKNILEMLDNPDYPSNLRLPKLINSFFTQLSQNEKEAFISLSVFRGSDFSLDAAVSIIGGDRLLATRTLNLLTRKSFIDNDPASKTYCLHSLIQSFAIEKGEREFSEIAFSSKTRFYHYYLLLIADLNEQFLSGDSLSAYQLFFEERDNFCITLSECFTHRCLREVIFHVMNRDYLFICFALAMMRSFMIDEMHQRLDVMDKNMRLWSLFNLLSDGCIISKNEYEVQVLCVQGLNEMIGGAAQYGAEIVTDACNDLGVSREQQILKCLCLQMLSLYYNHVKNVDKSKRYSKMAFEHCKQIGNTRLFVIGGLEIEDDNPECSGVTSINQMLISFNIIITLSAVNFLSDETKLNLAKIMHELQAQIVKEYQNPDGTPQLQLSTLLLLETVDRILIRLGHFRDLGRVGVEKTVQVVETELNTTNDHEQTENSPLTPDEMLRQNLLDDRLVRGFLMSDVKIDKSVCLASAQRLLDSTRKLCGDKNDTTAFCYFKIGIIQNEAGDYTIAKKSLQRALDVWLSLHGEHDYFTAACCHYIGMTQVFMQDFSSALSSFQQALDIRLKVDGDEKEETALSYFVLGALQCHFLRYKVALELAQHALDIMLKLYGEQHEMTACFYFAIGSIQNGIQDHASALESHRRALEIRIKLCSDHHESVAASYFEMGKIQYTLEDYTSALDSHQHALNVRSKLFGDEHEETAGCYFEMGLNQLLLRNYSLAIESHQRALHIRIKLHGEKHEKTVHSYLNLCIAQRDGGYHTLALDSGRKALDSSLNLHGGQHITASLIYFAIGTIQHLMHDYSTALESCERALDIALHQSDEHLEHVAACYFQIGLIRNAIAFLSKPGPQRELEYALSLFLNKRNRSNPSNECPKTINETDLADFSLALDTLQRALEIRKRVGLYGEQHEETAQSYFQVGVTQNNMGNHDLALQSFQRALDIRIKLHTACEHVTISDSYFQVGVMQWNIGDYEFALNSHQHALDIRMKLHGQEHETTAESYSKLGDCQLSLKDHNLALKSYQRALDINLKLHGEQSEHVASNYSMIGYALFKAGDDTSSLNSFQRAIDIQLRLNREPNEAIVSFYFMKGLIGKKIGNYKEALCSQKHALEILLKPSYENSVIMACTYHEIGSIQNKMENYSSAVESLHISLLLKLKFFGRDLITADTYYELASAQCGMKRYNSALEFLGHALQIRTTTYGNKERNDIASTYNMIGIAEYHINNFKAALESFYKTIKILWSNCGKMHSDTAECYQNISMVYKSMGKQDLAFRNAQLALDIRSAIYGKDHTQTQESLFLVYSLLQT